MKKTYKIDVDCAACAEKMQEAIKNTEGVESATVSFMTLKCKVEAARENCKKVESDCEIFI